MLFKLEYESKKEPSKKEILIPDADIWNGLYRDTLYPVYIKLRDAGKDLPKINQYRAGLVWEMNKDDYAEVELPVIKINLPKTKIKISEVFSYASTIVSPGRTCVFEYAAAAADREKGSGTN